MAKNGTVVLTKAYYRRCAKRIMEQAKNQKPMPNGAARVGLTCREFATLSGYALSSVYNYVAQGLIQSIKVSDGHTQDVNNWPVYRVIPISELVRFKKFQGQHKALGVHIRLAQAGEVGNVVSFVQRKVVLCRSRKRA